MTASIQPLPSDVAKKIKSSTAINHLNGVIVELVKNALDANSQSISVMVDYRRGGCVIEDDGDGIFQAEFEPEGGLGKAYHTSKFNSATMHRKGCFLASLSSLALLTITSHRLQQDTTSTVIFHHSNPVARLTPAPRHHGLKCSEHGTRVTVNDLFGNMPVRVKNRALTLQKPDKLDRQWDDLKHSLIALMISNDGLRKLTVSDVDGRKWTIRPRRGDRDDGDLDLTRLNSILTQSILVETHSPNLWHWVSATVPHLTINAALSLSPSPSKKVQFISLGPDPLFQQSQTNILYSEVNRLFSLSDFGSTESASSLYPATGIDGRKFIPKSVNKWPMFYIRIDAETTVLSGDGGELPESDRALQRILDILTLMINEYLKEHKMRPRGGKRQRQESVQADLSESGPKMQGFPSSELSGNRVKLPSFSRSGVGGHFGSWSRVKSANSHASGSIVKQVLLRRPPPENLELDNCASITPATQSDLALESTFNDRPFKLLAQDKRKCPESRTETPGVDTIIPWIDPHTGIRHSINSRTGQSLNVRPSAASALANRPRTTGSIVTRRGLDSSRRPASAVPEGRNMWLENLLNTWNSPVFGRSERPLSAIDTDPVYNGMAQTGQSFHKSCGLDNFEVSKYRGKLHKRDLATAEVIGQVDRKFILVKMVASSPSTLVLIDQHAADERCRVEGLSEELFDSDGKIQIVEVEAVVFDIPATETTMFKRYAGFFAGWGIDYVVEHNPRSRTAAVLVSKLPALIAERCRTEPDLLANIIRTEVWNQAEDGNTRPQTPTMGNKSGAEGWVGRLAGCPQGIIDLLNSRACRTAIMFNDALSIEECKSLVGRLANCVLPFQCAHGRPSMVPLVDLRGSLEPGLDEYAELGRENIGVSGAFKQWQHKAG
ncbi:hypothetical protein BJX70DRAFT_138037 [Aspergillus crustosus]